MFGLPKCVWPIPTTLSHIGYIGNSSNRFLKQRRFDENHCCFGGEPAQGGDADHIAQLFGVSFRLGARWQLPGGGLGAQEGACRLSWHRIHRTAVDAQKLAAALVVRVCDNAQAVAAAFTRLPVAVAARHDAQRQGRAQGRILP